MIKKFFRDNPIHKKIVPFIDLIMISSPVIFFFIWPLLSIGILIYFLSIDATYVNIYNVDMNTLLFFVGCSMFVAGTSIVNSINAFQKEKVNKFSTIGSKISISHCQSFSYALLVIGATILFYLSYKIVISILMFAIFWGVIYGHEKFQGENDYINILFCYILSGYSLVLTGYLFGFIYLGLGDISFFNSFINSLFYQLVYVLLSLSIVIVILSNNNQKYFNKEMAIYLSLVLFVVSFLIGMRLLDPLSTTFSLSCIPFILYACIRGMEKDFIRVISYSVLFLNLYVFTIHPFLFFPSVIVYYLSKYYYWHRFDLHYPSLVIGDDSDNSHYSPQEIL